MKLKLTEQKIGFLILTTGVTLNYLFDGVNKFGGLYFPPLERFAIFYRLLLECVCLFITLIYLNKRRLIWLSCFVYFVLCFFIGNLYLKYIINIDVFLLEQFIYFNKYFFIFFIFFGIYKVLDNRELLVKIISNFKRLFILNGVLALAGFLMNIELFHTFPRFISRFGYDGLIFAQNEASIFYLLGLFVFYFDWKVNKQSIIKLFFVVFLCILTGMKAVFLGVILLLLFHFLSRMSVKKILYIVFGFFFSIVVLLLSVSKLKVLFGYYYYFYLNRGALYTLLGGRNTFMESRVIPYLEKLDIINYMIGGQNISNVNYYLALVEMDFIDLFLFFGVVNGLIFLILFKNYIVGKIKNKLFYFVVVVFFLLSFFSGHFFTSSLNPIFIIIIFAYINSYIDERKVY